MRTPSRIAAISATILSCVGLVLTGASTASASAQARTVNLTFCNDSGSQFYYQAEFPQRGGFSTYLVMPGQCLPSWDFVSPGEPYITRVYSFDGGYRDTAGYTVWDCNERVTLFGSYENTNMEQKCV
jgi:hypothetical protein